MIITKVRNCAKLELRKSGIGQFLHEMTLANDCANVLQMETLFSAQNSFYYSYWDCYCNFERPLRGYSWFTKVLFNLLSKNFEPTFIWLIMWFKYCRFSVNSNMLFCTKNSLVTFVKKPQYKIISFRNYKHLYLIHTWSDWAFDCTLVNQALSSF